MASDKIYSLDELRQYERGWSRFMVDIWHERQMQLHVKDTGALMGSVHGTAADGVITHTFLEYGIYVAAGVGNHYEHNNGGDLPFLGRDYREEHGLNKPRKRGPKWGGGYTSGKPRERRDWFSAKYLYSMRRLNEKEAEFYGEKYMGMMSTALDALFAHEGTLRSL